MTWKNLSYWIKGGILAILISIIIVPLSIFIAMNFLGAEDNVIWFLAPEFFMALLSLGMRGTPAGIVELIITLGVSTIIFLVRFFIIGAVLGIIYNKLKFRNKGKFFVIGLILLWIIFLLFVSYRTQRFSSAYGSVDSPGDCESIFRKGIENFDINRCYKDLAIKNEDLSICDRIKIFRGSDDYKWFCYEEVAHAKDDSSICNLIPEKTYNEHNVETMRRKGCLNWFNR
ncbi:MAG: hypothetical protein ACTSVB_04105 [Candidatus Heimdallarchaeaceae archaeon]